MSTVRVTQIVQDLSDHEDRQESPAGVRGIGSYQDYHNMTLDEFHRAIPIGCLDDFDITEIE